MYIDRKVWKESGLNPLVRKFDGKAPWSWDHAHLAGATTIAEPDDAAARPTSVQNRGADKSIRCTYV